MPDEPTWPGQGRPEADWPGDFPGHSPAGEDDDWPDDDWPDDDEAGPPWPPPSGGSGGGPRRRRPLVLAAIAVAALVVGAGVTVAVSSELFCTSMLSPPLFPELSTHSGSSPRVDAVAWTCSFQRSESVV